VKFISGAVNYNGDPIEILQKRILKRKCIAFWNCVDLPATGSEMNSGAVVTIEATKKN
jgi:NADP-dependent alcohol dehydrogenase